MPHDDSRLLISDLTTIEPKPIEWLWPGRVPMNTVTVWGGDGGLGKSCLTFALAALISTGSAWPFSKAKQPAGEVVIFNAEDDIDNVILPRLNAHHADISKIHCCDGIQTGESSDHFCIDRDIETLGHYLNDRSQIRFVVVDPVTAFLANTNANHMSEVQSLMRKLSAMARAFDVSVNLITHLSKPSKAILSMGSAAYRVMGSIAFCTAARSAWLIAKDPQDDDRRLVLNIKSNLARSPKPMAFTLVDHGGVPVVEWDDRPIDVTADTVATNLTGKAKQADAVDTLRDILADGPVGVSELAKRAKASGISDRTLERARATLGVVTTAKRDKAGKIGGWECSLPLTT